MEEVRTKGGNPTGTTKKRKCAESLTVFAAKNEIVLLYVKALKIEKVLVLEKNDMTKGYINKQVKK